MGDKLHVYHPTMDVMNVLSLRVHRQQLFSRLWMSLMVRAPWKRDTAPLIWGLATYHRLYLSALKYCHLSEEVYRFRLDHVGTHTLCPAKMKGQGQRPQEWWLSSEERQGQPLLTGQIHSTGSQLTGLFFKQDLKQQGQSSPRHGSHSNHVIGKGSHCRVVMAATEGASRTFSF